MAHNTKKRLVASVAAMAVCFSMFVGSTFAWFTDTASSGVNTITAGNLDIELYKGAVAEGAIAYTAKVDEKTKMFNDSALWEPGHVEVAYLKVENKGSLALEYKLNINVSNEVEGKNADGDAIKLSEVLKFKAVEIGATDFYATREAAIAANATAGELKTKIFKDKITTMGEAKYYALIVYMPTDVNNDANHNGTDVPSIQLGVKLDATQTPYENDSFGEDYDKNAASTISVNNLGGFQDAIVESENNGTISIESDMTITGSNGGDLNNTNKTTNIVLNGNTVTAATGNAGFGIRNKAVANISGGNLVSNESTYSAVLSRYDGAVANISDMNLSNSKENGTALCARDNGVINVENTVINSTIGGCVDSNGGTISVKNCTFNQTGTDTDLRSTLFLACFGGVINIDGGDYTGENKGLYIITSGGEFNVYGGNFKANEVIKADLTNYNNSYPGATSVFNIYGGNFDGKIVVLGVPENTVNIVAGTFKNIGISSELFKTYVAEGSTVTEENGVYTVTKN